MKETMMIRIDTGASTPIYLQIVERLHSLMVAGKLSPGDQLPSVRQLAKDLGINFNTVARAYGWLEEAGLISMHQGRGTYVLERPLAALERQRLLRQESLDQFVERIIKESRHLGFAITDVQAALAQHAETE